MRKALPGFFFCIFSSLTCLKERVFSKRDLLQWKVPAKLYWDLLTSGRYQPACEKIPALLYVGKGPEYRPFHDFQLVPLAYRPRAEISNHGRALYRPFSSTLLSNLLQVGGTIKSQRDLRS